MGLQRERVLGGAVALVGVLLALPSVVAPTWYLATFARQRGQLVTEEWDWSWGRSRVVGAAGVALQDLWNPLGLTIFVVLLVVAAAGAVVWMAGAGPWGAVLGPVAVAVLAGRLVSAAIERQGRPVRTDVYGLYVTTDTPSAGVLESAAAVVLLVALALMAYTLLRGDLAGSASWASTPWWGRRHTPSEATGSMDGPGGGSRVTVSLLPAGEHLSASPVTFGDPADEEAGR
jgi:hypothetical protein